MKRPIAFGLALALAVSTAAPALAEGNSTSINTDNIGAPGSVDVQGEYVPKPIQDVIQLDITWDPMNFTYNAGGSTWNPATHTYDDKTNGWTWDNATPDKSAPAITVTNHSNTGIAANFAFTPDSAVNGLTGRFSQPQMSLDSAVDTNAENPPKGESTFTLSGGIDQSADLGNITVTIKTGTKVSTSDDLEKALSAREPKIVLMNDIGEANRYEQYSFMQLAGDSNYAVTIDLNGHTLYNIFKLADSRYSLTLKNGTIASSDEGTPYFIDLDQCAYLTAENVTFYAEEDAAYSHMIYATSTNDQPHVILKNCTFHKEYNGNGIILEGVNAAFSGTTRIETRGGENYFCASAYVTCLAGTYNFDPRTISHAYLGSGCTVSGPDNGIYTVTANTAN